MPETQLLDQYGRPIRRQALTKRQATAQMTGVRQLWAPSVASGLTPDRMAAILRAASESDDPHDYLVLAEEMEERDAHYASVLGIRKRAISGIQPIVHAASDDAGDQRIAEAVRERIAEHESFPDLVEDLLDGIGKGYAAVEIGWKRTAREWWPESFDWVDPRWLRWDRETGRELRLLDEADPVHGVPLAPFKYAIHRPRLKSGLPLRGGIARLVAFGWLCKAYTVKDWVSFIEIYGLPIRLGRYGPEATEEDVSTLYKAVASIGTDAAAVLPESMKIEFQALASAAQGSDIFEKLARWTDEQTSKAVLGQTMTSDNGSSKAQAEVHNEVRLDIAQADARQVAGTIGRDIIRPFVDLNFGMQADYPRLELVIEEAEDLAAFTTSVTAFMDRGLPVKVSDIRGRFGLGVPEDGDEVIGGATKPDAPPAAALNRLARALNRETRDPYADLDPIETEADLRWERELDGVIGPILSLVDEAGSLQEVQRRLPELLGEMEVGDLIQGLVAAMFQARVTGDLGD